MKLNANPAWKGFRLPTHSPRLKGVRVVLICPKLPVHGESLYSQQLTRKFTKTCDRSREHLTSPHQPLWM